MIALKKGEAQAYFFPTFSASFLCSLSTNIKELGEKS
jgi:hypothetical protein